VNEYLVPQQRFLSRIFEKFRDCNFDGLERTDKNLANNMKCLK